MQGLKITILFFLFFGCQKGAKDNNDFTKNDANYLRFESTDLMIKKVKNAVSKIDVLNVPYILNGKKAELLQANLQSVSGFQRTTLLFSYGLELMKKGDIEKAITILTQVLNEVNGFFVTNATKLKKKNDILFMVKKQLALAYMRKAETDNCIANHNNESCIVPISSKAQHILKEGAEKCITLLNELLSINPNDNDCIYLLNIAHMTLGQYPKGVPIKFRIPKTYFDKGMDFPKFKDVAANLGVDINQNAGGTCIDDFNNDGYLDIIASSWGFDDQIRYFENDKMGGFIDRTLESGLNGVTGGLNLRHADFDNDGFLDFIILRGAWLGKMGAIPNSLIKNNGNGTFKDVSMNAGIYSTHPTQTAVWSDFNLDGWLDLFIANESSEDSVNPCELFLNNTNGTFTNIMKDSGISSLGFFKGVSVGDINNDMYPDIYLSNYLGENTLYLNKSDEFNRIQFEKVRVNVEKPIRSFSTWMFDYNNDGYEDIFVSGYSTDTSTAAAIMMENIKTGNTNNRPYLYKNNGDMTFTDVALETGLNEPMATMGCNYGDLNNDGFLDFYLATGDPELFSIVPNRMFLNTNGKKFQDVTFSGGFGHIQKGHAIGFGDLDLDGDQDIYAVMGGAYDGDVYQNLLFENPTNNENHWVHIKLKGTKSNQAAIGAKIVLTISEREQQRKIYHTVGTGASFGGNSIIAELGLGKAKKINSIEIFWPNKNKTKSIFYDIPVNKMLSIIEEHKEVKILDLKKVTFNLTKEHHH